MDLNITPPHLGRTASPSLGVGTTSPGGACAHTHTHTHTLPHQHFHIIEPGLPHLSPIEVKISPEAGPQKVRAWGPGLEGGVVGKSADFVVEAVGDDVGTLGKCGMEAELFPVGLAEDASWPFFCVQVSRLKVHLRPRLNVTTKVTARVMCATGPQSQGSMLCTFCATTKTSSTPPSWLRSSPRPAKTSTLTR